MYELTLTKSERDAIDWVGGRYAHGHDFYCVLYDCQKSAEGIEPDDIEWGGDYPITFGIPEHKAWEINQIIDADNLACFSRSLCRKLCDFSAQIV